MKDGLGFRLGAAGLLLIAGLAAGAPGASAQAPAAPGASIQGLWRNTDTTIRVVVSKNEARGTFVEVGQGAKALGFKPGETSFVGTVDGHYLRGEQTIRYGGTCFPTGRKIPMMARLTPDGRSLAMHNYVVGIDASCRDTGEYDVAQTLWQRPPGR